MRDSADPQDADADGADDGEPGGQATSSSDNTKRPWQTHLSVALVLASGAFALGEVWSVLGGAAMGAVAVFVALRPLFRKDRRFRRE